jgi:hypothetical protein
MSTLAANVRAPDGIAVNPRVGAEPRPGVAEHARAPERLGHPALRRVLLICGLAGLLGAAYGIGRLEGELSRERVAEQAAAETERHSAKFDDLRALAAAQEERARLLEARRELHRAALDLVAYNFGMARERLSRVARALRRPEVAPKLSALGTELGTFAPAVAADVAADRRRLDALAERFDVVLDATE